MSATSSPKLTDIGVVSAAMENIATKGTAASLTTADAGIEVYDPQIAWTLPVADRNPVRPHFDPELSVAAGPRSYGLNFSTACKGAVAAGLVPEFADLMRASGLAQTIVPATSVTYAPVSAIESQETATVGLYADGNRYLLAGAMSDATFRFTQGEIPMIDFALQGTYLAPTATAIPTGTELNNVTPPSVDGVTLTYRSSSLIATAVQVQLNNAVQLRKDITQAGGVRHAYIRGRDVTITVDPEVDPVGTRDFVSQIVDGTAGAFVIAIGSTAGNICTVTCPMVQVVEAGPQERDGLQVYSLTLKARAASPAGDDSISIAFT